MSREPRAPRSPRPSPASAPATSADACCRRSSRSTAPAAPRCSRAARLVGHERLRTVAVTAAHRAHAAAERRRPRAYSPRPSACRVTSRTRCSPPWSRTSEHGSRTREDGRRKARDGRRKTEDGRRKTEDGRRKAEDGRRRTRSLPARFLPLPWIMEKPWNLRQRTILFAVSVIQFCRTLPRNPECAEIASQLRRASSSIGAHYAAASRNKSGL